MAEGPAARRPEGHLRARLQSAGAQPDSRGCCLGRSRDESRTGGRLGPPRPRGSDPRCWRPSWLLTLGAGPAALACRDAQGHPARCSGVHVPRPGCTWLSISGTGVPGTLFETCVSPRSLAYKEHPGCLCISQHFLLQSRSLTQGGHPRGPSRTKASELGLKQATALGSHECRGSGRPSGSPAPSHGLGSAGPQGRGRKGAPRRGGAGEKRTSPPSSKAAPLPPGIHASLPSHHGSWGAGSRGRKALTGTAPLGV